MHLYCYLNLNILLQQGKELAAEATPMIEVLKVSAFVYVYVWEGNVVRVLKFTIEQVSQGRGVSRPQQSMLPI